MNLADPELELVDPTPNVHSLFVHFDKEFFWMRLASRAAVRWSKRMYSCAGICSYDRGGLCDIALSEPLLKLRPRKDLVETLLHEMIHAFLFITNRDQDRDGHGPNFKAHMHRINNSAGLNISIYHDFHDEVELYKTHWWRCNGPCQTRKPHFGIVRRSANRAPNPKDYWWNDHMRKCGGTFIKIKEPEPKKKGKATLKPMADITKFITIQNSQDTNKPLLAKTKSKEVTVPRINVPKVLSPQNNKSTVVFGGKGQSLIKTENTTSSNSVADTVRSIWANKTLPGIATSSPIPVKRNISTLESKNSLIKSPPAKMKKIDDYFKAASSVLKDVYGEDFQLGTSDNSNRIIIVNNNNNENDNKTCDNYKIRDNNLVDCPICSSKVKDTEINRHLDECLNKDVIEELTTPNTSQTSGIEDTSDISTINNSLIIDQKCACCNKKLDKPLEQHLDECLAFFDSNVTIPTEGMPVVDTIVIEDDSEDILNESQILNDTGTKYPCPCCMKMVEEVDMNNHLDKCLGRV